MRRLVTAFVVGGVIILVALAAADAFRGSGGESAAPETTSTFQPQGHPTLSDTLRRESISGSLFYSDFLCRLRTIQLPSMKREQVVAESGAELARCRFSLGAGRILPAGAVAEPSGTTVARCRTGRITVFNPVSRRVFYRIPGCVPAWRPDGTLALVRGDHVVERSGTYCRRAETTCERVLVSQRQLRSIALSHPNLEGLAPDIRPHVAVTELVWLNEQKIAAVLRISVRGLFGEPLSMLALLKPGQAAETAVRFDAPIRGLTVSPLAGFLAAEPGIVMNREGRSWDLPRTLQDVHVFGFSPDDRWIAIGTRASVFLVSVNDLVANDATPRMLRLPLVANDLVWEPGGPSIDISRAG